MIHKIKDDQIPYVSSQEQSKLTFRITMTFIKPISYRDFTFLHDFTYKSLLLDFTLWCYCYFGFLLFLYLVRLILEVLNPIGFVSSWRFLYFYGQ